MKLTKLQRYTAYVILLDEFMKPLGDKYWRICICLLFDEIFGFGENDLHKILPELYAKRTVKPSGLIQNSTWFNSESERIAALKQCIKETEPQ